MLTPPFAKKTASKHLFSAILITCSVFIQAPARPKPASTADSPQLILQVGHSSIGSGIAFSPDGARVASAAWDGTIRIWNRKNGLLEQVLYATEQFINTLAWSPNGKILAAGGGNDEKSSYLALWDARTGRSIRSLPGHTQSVRSVTFSPDGKYLASASDDKTARVWDVASGAQVSMFTEQKDGERWLSYSNDGMIIASQSLYEDGVKLWNPRTGLLLKTLPWDTAGAGIWVYGGPTAFSPGSAILAAGQNDGTVGAIQFWNLETGERLQRLSTLYTDISALVFSRDGKTLASAYNGVANTTIQLWNPTTGVLKRTISKENGGGVTTIVFSPDGRTLAATCYDGSVRLWNAATGALERTWSAYDGRLKSISYSADGRTLAAGAGVWNTNLLLWDTQSGQLNRCIRLGGSAITSVALSLNRKVFATGTDDFDISLWDITSGTVTSRLTHPNNDERGRSAGAEVLFSPDGKRLVAGGRWKAELWDLSGRQPVTSFGAGQAPLAYSPNGKRIALSIPTYKMDSHRVEALSASRVHLIDPEHKAATVTLAQGSDITAIAFSPDSRLVAVASSESDNTLKLWDASSGVLLRTIPIGDGRIERLCFSHHSKWVAGGGWGSSIRVWDAATGELRETIGPSDGAFAVGPNDKTIVGGGADGLMHFWDLQSGRILLSLAVLPSTAKDGKPEWIAFTPDGYYDASPGAEQSIRWRWKNQLYPAVQFEAMFHRPDKVREALRNQ